MEFSLSIESLMERVSVVATVGETELSHIAGVATLDAAGRGDLSFVNSGRRRQALAASAASVVIVPEGFDASPKPGQLFLQARNPSLELAKVCELIAAKQLPKPPPGIHPTACVSPDARVDASASVGPFVVVDAGSSVAAGCVVESHCRIESDARLGEDCWLSAGVVVGRASVLGKRVRIHSGSVLGADGFGYEFEDGRHRKVPQIGNVVVGDDVEIGACTTIDRGRLGPTTIGEGTKIDNQVQVGHNVSIGKHCILCSQVGIAGSVSIGDYVVFGGKSGSSGHVAIESGVQVAGGAYVFSDTPAKSKLGGAPAIPLMAHQRITLLTRRLPELFNRLKRLEDELLPE